MDSRATRPSVDPRTSLALWLRAGRTQSRLSLDEVARVTKIQPRILEQLEAGQLEGLPAEVFVRGFVKSFARCVGLSESEALKRYIECAGAASLSSATAKAYIETLVATPGRTRMAAGTVPPPLGNAARPSGLAKPSLQEAPSTVAEPSIASEVCVAANRKPEVPTGRTKKQRGRRRKAAKHKKLQAGQGGMAAAAVYGTEASSAAIAEGAVCGTEASSAAVAEGADCSTLASSAAVAEGADCSTLASSAAVAEGAEALRVVVEEGAVCGAEALSAAVAATAERAADSRVPVIATEAAPSSPANSGQSAEQAASRDAQPNGADEPRRATTRAQPGHSAVRPATLPRVPWRRPAASAVAKPVAPSLVIDDADPERADIQRDEREAAKKPGPQRVSFLPPILLDRDERSGRQGGLTLAVILLLIAATLTLSYLMRRPTVSGDGVTSNASDGPAVAVLVPRAVILTG